MYKVSSQKMAEYKIYSIPFLGMTGNGNSRSPLINFVVIQNKDWRHSFYFSSFTSAFVCWWFFSHKFLYLPQIFMKTFVKFVHKYQWKLFTNTIESLHGSISTHWPLKLKLDPEAGFCSYNWRGMSRHCLILILNIFLLVLNTFLLDINYSATFNILAKSPLDIIPYFWQLTICLS